MYYEIWNAIGEVVVRPASKGEGLVLLFNSADGWSLNQIDSYDLVNCWIKEGNAVTEIGVE